MNGRIPLSDETAEFDGDFDFDEDGEGDYEELDFDMEESPLYDPLVLDEHSDLDRRAYDPEEYEA